MHCDELVSTFMLLLLPVYYTSRVSDCQGVGVCCPDFVPSYQLTPQDLPDSLQVCDCDQLPRSVLGVLSCLRNAKLFIAFSIPIW